MLFGRGCPFSFSFGCRTEKRYPMSCVHLYRKWNPGEKFEDASPACHTFDAVMDLACRSKGCEKVRVTPRGLVVLDQTGPVTLSDGLTVQLKRAAYDADDNVVGAVLVVSAYDLDASQVLGVLAKAVAKHQLDSANQLGGQLHYFEQICVRLLKGHEGVPNYDNAPRTLAFEATPFRCCKTLDSVYGAAAKVVRDRVRRFQSGREWYDRHGQPWTLGMLLHGPPGCGKTSVIKAIAKECGRHVVSCRLSENVTVSQLRNLLQSATLTAQQSASTRFSYTIPVEERLYVFEDADELGSLFPPRGAIQGNGAKGPGGPTGPCGHPEQLTLPSFLNILDGVLEMPGRMIVFTTNHLPELDPALVRPGRFDLVLKFDACTLADAAEMCSGLTGWPVGVEELSRYGLTDESLTPAELTQLVVEVGAEDSARPDALRAAFEARAQEAVREKGREVGKAVLSRMMN